MTRVAVVGATGNVGTALLRRLQAEEAVTGIVGIARRIPDRSADPYAGVEWHSVDVGADGAVAALTPLLEHVDAVVHLAWALQPTHDIPTQYRVNVEGTAAVLEAAAAAGVGQVVVASSVGTYRAADKRLRVDESWPVDGMATATYSIHKALNEAALDEFADTHPDIVVTRLRPGLVFQQPAAAEIRGLFLGHLVPMRVVRAARWAVLPLPGPFVFQAVHADDLADAYWRTIDRRAAGAFNIAAGPVLTPPRLAAVLGMRRAVRIPLRLLRAVVTLTWHLRIQPTDAGWIDIAANVPIMRTDKAREELGWEPQHTAVEAFADLVEGFRQGSSVPASGPLRG
ncbi:NAD-dependent epimerase/dehydratase family protein [Curtobacterium sp. MCBD17_035]|uniref:NAD-dependent epimerase/dehydratase family protein n=1 Tax=Curtobacterium sp. MCBD17_035 TaxID=2175673 RepID=UPI000DAA2E48|nr:NAD-dependent epimerase/dehydratase family protein [Curtobacterium sp. MCBD17_035]WIB67235.1 NAD-dependent epimerase/dehydratase family protein [Curtobacterium sp. MCBD17_035]